MSSRLPGSSVRGMFFRQEYWSGLPFRPPGDLPDPGTEPGSPALAGGLLNTEPPGKPKFKKKHINPNEISLLSITLAKIFINSVMIGTCPEAGRHAAKLAHF